MNTTQEFLLSLLMPVCYNWIFKKEPNKYLLKSKYFNATIKKITDNERHVVKLLIQFNEKFILILKLISFLFTVAVGFCCSIH